MSAVEAPAPSDPARVPPAQSGGLWPAIADAAAILRFHIIGVAVTAALVFGWLFTGRDVWAVALVGGLDWLFINLLNRVTDLKEDLANGIRGTERIARRPRLVLIASLAALVLSFPLLHAHMSELTVLRLLVQAIGLGYSFAIIPSPSGWKRFKDLYFFKNFMSAVLFGLTVFAYPLAVYGTDALAGRLPGGLLGAAVLLAFFLPFELTYEILYDLRDLEGDRLARIPTYPVVHGPETARAIIDGLLLGCTLPLMSGLLLGLIGIREGLMLAAPAVQLAFYRPRLRRGLTSRDCILLTHLGSALLLLYLAGTRVWLAAGLPENVVLR